jgi:hypothetical protein
MERMGKDNISFIIYNCIWRFVKACGMNCESCLKEKEFAFWCLNRRVISQCQGDLKEKILLYGV